MSFLGAPVDHGPRGRSVTLQGHATSDESGLTFSSTSDYASVPNFVYADDSAFSISLWISKEQCESNAAEVLFSHSQAFGAGQAELRNSEVSNINIQLLCEGLGAGRPEFDMSSLHGSAIRCECCTQLDLISLYID